LRAPQNVPDDGDLAGAMASYYELFAAGVQTCEVRWLKYEDVVTGTDLLAACLPVFELANGVSTCDSAAPTSQWSKLLGVSCVDINIMVDLQTLERHPQYLQFKEAYETQTKQCPNIDLSDSIRSDMQARVGSSATCRCASLTALHFRRGRGGGGGGGGGKALEWHPILQSHRLQR
jgi:hypothetical protein